jgi:hypothetical protein
MRPLLLFDLNGVLADKCINTPYNSNSKNEIMIPIRNNYHWIIKNETIELLKKLSITHDIGIWTSTHRKNCEKVVDFLFKENDIECSFFFDRSHCDNDDRYYNHETVKLLDKFKHLIGDRKVIIIDDTLSKVNLNNQDSYLCVNPNFSLSAQLTLLQI